MSKDENNYGNKLFFRQNKIDGDVSVSLPEDMQWAAGEGAEAARRKSARRSSADSVATNRYRQHEGDPGEASNPDYSNLNAAAIPKIISVENERVNQDPQGTATVDILVGVQGEGNVDFELRYTR